jgi:hypothetical protein
LIFFSDQVDLVVLLHLIIKQLESVFLSTEYIGITIFIGSLLDYETADFAIFFGEVVPDYVTARSSEESIAPSYEVNLNSNLFSSFVHVLDEVVHLRILVSEFLEVGLNTY